MGRLAQSVQRLATGWTVQGSNTGGGEIFRTSPDRLWGPLNLLYNGYRVFPGGKAAGAWRWPPTHLCAFVVCSRVNLLVTVPITVQADHLNISIFHRFWLYVPRIPGHSKSCSSFRWWNIKTHTRAADACPARRALQTAAVREVYKWKFSNFFLWPLIRRDCTRFNASNLLGLLPVFEMFFDTVNI